MNALQDQDQPPAVAAAPAPLPLPILFTSEADCKCCGNAALLAGYVDFDRDCYGYNARRGRARGVPVPYYRCSHCEFAFTDAFDDWTHDDFRCHVYNAEYVMFDPNFDTVRPRKTADRVSRLFTDRRLRILDFGCGNGRTVDLLREAGFAHVEGYDPYHAKPVKPAQGDFDLVVCVEVAEHTTQPLQLFAELSSWTAAHGVILFSTRDFADVGGRWVDDWYVAPRNGHVSFYTRKTLSMIAASLGRSYYKIDIYRHLLGPLGSAA